MKKRGRKAQAWGIDLAVALMIFTFGIIIFFVYAVNKSNDAGETLDTMIYEGNVIADSILSEGNPKNWDFSNVVALGILSDNKINETKLENFYYLSVSDYSKTKQIFNTNFNYYFYLSKNMTINGSEVEGIGKEPSDEKDLVKITRFTIYEDTPSTANIYIWE
jgi:hypothetical protein